MQRSKLMRIRKITEGQKLDVIAEINNSNDFKDASQEKKDKRLKELSNITLNVTRQVKNVVKWNDPEAMVMIVDIIKKMSECEASDTVDLNEEELDLLRLKYKEAAKSGVISGFALEKFVEIYKDI